MYVELSNGIVFVSFGVEMDFIDVEDTLLCHMTPHDGISIAKCRASSRVQLDQNHALGHAYRQASRRGEVFII